MNPMAILKVKAAWDRFQAAHPKFPAFLQAASGTIRANTVIEISITTEDGRKIASNLKISEEDMELLQELKNLREMM